MNKSVSLLCKECKSIYINAIENTINGYDKLVKRKKWPDCTCDSTGDVSKFIKLNNKLAKLFYL